MISRELGPSGAMPGQLLLSQVSDKAFEGGAAAVMPRTDPDDPPVARDVHGLKRATDKSETPQRDAFCAGVTSREGSSPLTWAMRIDRGSCGRISDVPCEGFFVHMQRELAFLNQVFTTWEDIRCDGQRSSRMDAPCSTQPS